MTQQWTTQMDETQDGNILYWPVRTVGGSAWDRVHGSRTGGDKTKLDWRWDIAGERPETYYGTMVDRV